MEVGLRFTSNFFREAYRARLLKGKRQLGLRFLFVLAHGNV